jgi:hypothetical protein
MMTLSLCLPLALVFQAQDLDASLTWILGGALLLCLIVMGLQFFKNAYYALIAPTYSLRHLAADDSIFFSILQVFFGGLAISFYALLLKGYITSSYDTWANNQISTALASYSNATYKPIVMQEGLGRMNDIYDLAWTGIIWIPALWLVIWLLISFLFWFTTKVLFANQLGMKVMASAVAYFFMLFGVIAGYFLMHIAGSTFAGTMMSPGILDIIGGILVLGGIIYLIIAIAQGGDLTPTQTVVIFVIWAAIIGGGIWALLTYQLQPMYSQFLSRLSSSDFVNQAAGK